jgi:anti-sigma factor ChrR (cupin superfamily)
MCVGGSAPRATITVPNYERYDRMADRQIEMIESIQNTKTLAKQQKLNRAIGQQQDALTELLAAEEARANATAADAQRMAALIGTPPPEPTAKAPVLGDNRQGMTRPEGKRSLRIDRKARSASAAGAGLNIARY